MKKTSAKLLISLLLGVGGLASFSTSALAEHDDERNSSVTANSTKCTGELITACGIKVVKAKCTGSSVSSNIQREEENDDDDHHHADHDSNRKDGSHSKNDHDYNDDSQRDHKDRSTGSDKEGDGKISICHRMGGAEHSLLVANDGWASGHSKHALDTIGRCEDFESRKNSDDLKNSDDDHEKDHKIAISDAAYSMGLTTTQIACLKGSPNTPFTINGVSNPGAGLNSSNFSISIQSANQGPSRGGARTLH